MTNSQLGDVCTMNCFDFPPSSLLFPSAPFPVSSPWLLCSWTVCSLVRISLWWEHAACMCLADSPDLFSTQFYSPSLSSHLTSSLIFLHICMHLCHPIAFGICMGLIHLSILLSLWNGEKVPDSFRFDELFHKHQLKKTNTLLLKKSVNHNRWLIKHYTEEWQ